MNLLFVLLCLLLTQIVTPRRGGGSFGRGSSGSRSSSRGWGSSSSRSRSSSSSGWGWLGGSSSSGRSSSSHNSYSNSYRPKPALPKPNYAYTNRFHSSVFSPTSSYLTRTAINTYIIRQSTRPYFVYGSHHYYWGSSYYVHNPTVVSEMQMCRYVFDASKEETFGEDSKLNRLIHGIANRTSNDELLKIMNDEVIETNQTETDTTTDHTLAHPKNLLKNPEEVQKIRALMTKLDEYRNNGYQDVTPTPYVPEGGVVNTQIDNDMLQSSTFGKVRFENGTRVREVSFGCPKSHVCCGLECCEMPTESLYEDNENNNEYYSSTDGDRMNLKMIFGMGFIIIMIAAYCCSHFNSKSDSYTVVHQTTTTDTLRQSTTPKLQPGMQMNDVRPASSRYFVPPPAYPSAPNECKNSTADSNTNSSKSEAIPIGWKQEL